jgi:hypothetical protein
LFLVLKSCLEHQLTTSLTTYVFEKLHYNMQNIKQVFNF